MTVARFVGIGVGEYDQGHPALDHAVPDVEAVAGLLGKSFECTLLRDPDEQSAKACLAGLRGSMPDGGSLVLLWSGHAIPSVVDGPRLLARDSKAYKTSGLGVTNDAAGPCAESGANQMLFIIDTCYSGAAVTAAEIVARILQQVPPEGQQVWVGVLTSCLPTERARDGEFGRHLVALLESGPEPGPDVKDLLVRRWSPQNEFISGYDLCDTLLKTWKTQAHSPDFHNSGSAWWMFRNPRYDAGAPERVVEHLLLAARGGADPDEHSWFTGRTTELDQVVAWVRSGAPGLHVVTGSAGTGKTAIAGRVVSLSNPLERKRLQSEGRPLGHADPGERSVHAHVHVRGLTLDRAADLIGRDLVRAGVLPAQDDPRNAAELVGQVQRVVEQGATPPVIVVDGLDEARAHTFAITEELLLRLAPYAVVIVSTRERRRGETEPSLLDVLTAGTPELDLDLPAAQERGRADMRGYIAWRLTDVDLAMDPDAVAGYLAGTASMTGSSPFLLARLVTDQLRAAPVDTAQPDWQDMVSHSVEDALDTDLAHVRALDGASGLASQSARILLAALTWGFGAGLPEEEWLVCANATSGGGFGSADVSWILDELGRYIIQDGEAGVAVYRIAHQSLADHIRPPFMASHQQTFDPQALPIAKALLERYETLLASGISASGPEYLWRYAWRHAAAAGLDGLDLLRALAVREDALLPDIALAAQEVGGRLADWGYRMEAVDPAEEAAQLYQELAAANPAFLPDLAGALNNLGIRYREVGRRQDALPPAEEAVQLYRELAAANPAFLPDLAMALNNLGVCYSELGRRQDALAPAEEAVQLRRELAAANPAFLPDLASVLNNLGIRYSELGRRQDALPPAEEAVQLYRELAAANPAFLPDLATSMNNLGNRFSEAGTPARGDAIWEQAITEAAPSAGAYLLVARASGTEPGNAKVAGWLVRSLALDSENRDLQGSVHELARRHRVPDPAAFDENWARHTGRPVPAWLTVDPVLLAAARAWVATDTYTAERDYLADHLELLEPDADIAVAEALLVVTEQAAGRYSALRQVAQRDGVAAAYQPLLLTILAREFTTADPHRQRELLVGRRDDLLSETVASALNELADQEGEIAILSQRASALLALARTGDDGLAFEALDEPGRFPALLHTLATQAEAGSLAPAAIAAYTIAATNAEAAAAMFYLAVGGVIQGNRDGAADLVKQARTADPDQVPSWINELAGIGQHHPGVLPLISMLTAPAAESSGDSE